MQSARNRLRRKVPIEERTLRTDQFIIFVSHSPTMPFLKQKTEIQCPFCSNEFEADMDRAECNLCGTVMYLDRSGLIEEHVTPEYHNYMFFGGLITSVLLSILILIEAVANGNLRDKLLWIAFMWGLGVFCTFVFPYTSGIPATAGSVKGPIALVVAIGLGIVLTVAASDPNF